MIEFRLDARPGVPPYQQIVRQVRHALRLGILQAGRRRVALSECTLSIPTGKVVGPVGLNGAGKTTLLHLAVGLLEPDRRQHHGAPAYPPPKAPPARPRGLRRPEHAGLRRMPVADHLRFGGWGNPAWDQPLAEERVEQLGRDPHQKAGTLSGGQLAQLALTLAIAKRPKPLILDEPLASLDPMARRESLQAAYPENLPKRHGAPDHTHP